MAAEESGGYFPEKQIPIGVAGKSNSFYDDVMQGVFSIFFSFLFLPSL
jgi:hypothetical protein